jgi:hypothetical protein
MKRLLVLVALAALAAAGCRAVAPCGGCCQPVACAGACECCPPNLADAAACGAGCRRPVLFPRYCGPGCDDGCTYGPYDCSLCGACRNPCGGFGAPGPGTIRSGDQYYSFNPGPPTGQTAYPYYTVRGPRDFLQDNPPPLGPY